MSEAKEFALNRCPLLWAGTDDDSCESICHPGHVQILPRTSSTKTAAARVHSPVYRLAHMSYSLITPTPGGASAKSDLLTLTSEAIERFALRDLDILLHSIRHQQGRAGLNIAVLGRFKSGKSSFLNHIIGRPLLPVGVLPVTSVVTSISFGARESAHIALLDGETRQINIDQAGEYIAESENPHNIKCIQEVRISLPSLQRFRGLTFVDTPGLESIFAHNTETSMAWTPNVDLALVAVSVDSPLTPQDVNLIERLHQFTPKVAVLLTKVDRLDNTGQEEVLQFITKQLREKFQMDIPVFLHSIHTGYESLGRRFEAQYILPALESFQENQAAIMDRKLGTLLGAIHDYLRLALKAMDMEDADRDAIRAEVLESGQSIANRKLGIRLMARHASGKTRPTIEYHFEKNIRPQLQRELTQKLDGIFPQWRKGFGQTLQEFEQWLRSELRERLNEVLIGGAGIARLPLEEFARQCENNLQLFRDQISETVMRVFGTPLRTTESVIELEAPQSPDISVGRIFDRNWELISALIPMWIFRPIIKQHFRDKIEHEVYKNLSRLTSQWDEAINSAISRTEHGVNERLDDLVSTVRGLLASSDSKRRETILSYLNQLSDKKEPLPVRNGKTTGNVTNETSYSPLAELSQGSGKTQQEPSPVMRIE